VPPQEKLSTFLSGALRVNPNMQVFGELNYVHNVTTFAVSQTPVSEAVTFTAILYLSGRRSFLPNWTRSLGRFEPVLASN